MATAISRPALPSMEQARTGATLVDSPTAAHEQPEVVENTARQANAKKILQDAVAATGPRQNWTRQEISAIYYQPLLELAHQAVSQTHPDCPRVGFPLPRHKHQHTDAGGSEPSS